MGALLSAGLRGNGAVALSMKIAKHWYKIQKFDNNVSLIYEAHVAPWLRCNIWHIRGRDHDLLIDTGLGIRPLKSEIVQLLEKPVKVILTHSHFDHVGGAHEFSCRLGHRHESHLIADQSADNADDTPDNYYPFVQAETFNALPYAKFDYQTFRIQPAPLTGFLDQGDVMDTGDRHFEIFHVPGHSPGSIALFERATAMLFTGDLIYDGDLLDNIYHSDPDAYRESLDRLSALPAETFHGGHFKSFDRDRMLEIKSEYLAGGRRITNAEKWVSQQITANKGWV